MMHPGTVLCASLISLGHSCSASGQVASTTTWTMWARTCTTTHSLRCWAIGRSATTSRKRPSHGRGSCSLWSTSLIPPACMPHTSRATRPRGWQWTQMHSKYGAHPVLCRCVILIIRNRARVSTQSLLVACMRDSDKDVVSKM